jgi:hypothetical protein
MQPKIIAFMAVLFSLFCVNACTEAPKPEMHSVKANFNIKVQDPLLKQLTTATDNIDIEATGEFNPGNYEFQGTKMTIVEGTTFRFALQLPIKDPNLISTQNASGQLQTSKPLQAAGVSLPQAIILSDGKVSGEVDLVRTMASFFFNLLQIQNLTQSDGSEVGQMIRTMHIETSKLALRPGAILKLGKSHLHIGPGSVITMNDLSVDKNLDYQGVCRIKLNFIGDSAYIGEKVETALKGGFITDCIAVSRKNSVLSLGPMPKQPAPKITLKDCTYRFGSQKTSSAHCDTSLITLNNFDWADNQHDDVPSDYHFDANMGMTGTHLLLNYPTYSVDAVFPSTEQASMKMFRDASGHAIDFATQEVLAKTGAINIHRPTTSIKLDLTDAKLGTIAFTKSGDVNFELHEGTSGLKAFEWSNGRRKFMLKTAGGSTIAITKGMAMALNKDRPGAKMQGTIPISVKLGDASLGNAKGNILDFSKLNGKIVVDLGQEVELTGMADFTIAQCKILGDTPADVKVRGFKLTSRADKTAMSLTGCSVLLPKGTITSMIKKQIPDEKIFDLNQEIFEEKKWRYKHGMITKLTVRHATIQNLKLDAPNKASFSITGDVEVDGTVDKTGILAAFKKDATKWDTRPWSASSPCTGTGSITFSLVPNKSLAASEMKYDLALQLPLPQNIDIDWKDVSGGLIRKAETSVISSYLNKCAPFHGTRTIPLDHSGTMKMFDAKNAKLQSIKITNFGLRPTPAGTEIDFVGEASL